MLDAYICPRNLILEIYNHIIMYSCLFSHLYIDRNIILFFHLYIDRNIYNSILVVNWDQNST